MLRTNQPRLVFGRAFVCDCLMARANEKLSVATYMHTFCIAYQNGATTCVNKQTIMQPAYTETLLLTGKLVVY